MNLQKSQLKILIANDLGADIEDRYDGQIKSAHELDGGAAALRQAATKVPGTFIAQVDKDLDEGRIKDMTALEVAEFVKKQLTRCGDFLGHLADVAQSEAVSQHGRAAGIKDAMEAIAKMRSVESEKLQRALSLVEEEGQTTVRPETKTTNAARETRGSARERKTAEAKKKAKRTRKKKANG